MNAAAGVQQRCDLLDDLRCVWVAVPDIVAAARLLEHALGFERRAGGARLPPLAGPPGSAGAPWAMFATHDETRGAICVFAGRGRPVHPGLPRGWDCVEAVAADVDASAAALASIPDVTVVRSPFTSDLSELGSNVHRSAIWRMPWGTHLILTTGLTEAHGREFPRAGSRTGRVFEVHLRTDRFAAARRFYADRLGMPSLIDVEHQAGPMHTAWSLPDGHPIRMSFLKTGDTGTGNGAVELQGHPGRALHPRDPFGAPVGGTAMVTFVTTDLAGVCDALSGIAGAQPTEVRAGPFPGRAVQVPGAEGELVQVVELG